MQKPNKPVKQKKESPYASGSPIVGTTLMEELRRVKVSARKTRHEPTYILDNADRTITRKIEKLMKPKNTTNKRVKEIIRDFRALNGRGHKVCERWMASVYSLGFQDGGDEALGEVNKWAVKHAQTHDFGSVELDGFLFIKDLRRLLSQLKSKKGKK